MPKKIFVKVISPWISVKDRLPEPWVDCLVYFPHSECGKYVIDCVSDEKKFTLDGATYHKEATHWMPLPKSPEEW